MSYVKIITQVNTGEGLNFSKDTERADVISRAFSYSNEGADDIAFMDMTACKEDRAPDVELMKKIAKKAEVPLMAYGGVKRLEDVKKMLYAGAELVYMGRAAKDDINFVKEMADRFGSDKIGVAIDLNDSNIKELRAQGLYTDDATGEWRKSHENPEIKDLYSKHLEKPNSHKAHELLHTDRKSVV